jgi:hypothetical protein
MQAVHKVDHREAIELALAGAQIFSLIEKVNGENSNAPEWLRVHEEQCCKHGAIWIHAQQQEGRSLPAGLAQQGLRLLARFEQLHPSPPPWIGNLRSDLHIYQNRKTAINSHYKLIVVLGNSQAHPLMLGLRQALPGAEIHFCPSVHLATEADVGRLHHRLASADLLVMHRIQPGYRNGIGLDCATLRALLPADGRSVVLPNLHYEGLHPWIGYAHDPDGRLCGLANESPLGPYHDFLAMVAARDDLPAETLLHTAAPAALLENLRQHHRQSLAELQIREADCDLSLSDWIECSHRSLPVAHTINHPTQAALDQLLRRLLICIGLPHQLPETLFDSIERLGALSIPIHPWVTQALEIESWGTGWGQRAGRPLSIEQQLQESVDFYRHHSWIVHVNARHPKLEFADALIELAKSPGMAASVPATPITPPLNVYNSIWVSDTPLQSLRELGEWALAQTPGDHSQLQQLVEAAKYTRDPELITAALARIASHHPPEPWCSYFELELRQAFGATNADLRLLARHVLDCFQKANQPWNDVSWRAVVKQLQSDEDPGIRLRVQKLLSSLAPLEQDCQNTIDRDLQVILKGRDQISEEDACKAASLYAKCRPSLRRPFAHWADPEVVDPSALDAVVDKIFRAKQDGRGFSLVRLGDGEGLFLCGRRPDIGGAIRNGTLIEARLAAQGNQLKDPEHEQLRRHLARAVANADWIGIPDLQQCLTGPIDLVTVASGLTQMLAQDQIERSAAHLVAGGWHIHNYLLQAGCFSRPPFDNVEVLIAPSVPLNLQNKPNLLWLQIPGEAVFRADAFGSEAHYPRVFMRILESIENCIGPGQLVLVGAGILGKIYCDAIRQRGGVAVDIGSVLDISSGKGGTRGEYRTYPWLHRQAKEAFVQS